MEHPSKLEINLNNLLIAMRALKQSKGEVERKGDKKLKIWLQNVETRERERERELDEIQKELEQLNLLGFLRNKFNLRFKLNKKVIELFKVVEVLNRQENMEVSKENGVDIEMMIISELEKGRRVKPNRYSYGQLMNIMISNVIIGRGGFGDVYRGKIGKVDVAVKVLRENVEKVIEKQFLNEMRIMFKTSHQNLVKLHGYCFHPDKKARVYEYMVNGSLDTVLYQKRVTLPWETLYNIAIETARAISHLHESYSEPIIHFDIKAANVILDSNFSPKITDFGLSKIYEKDLSHVIQTRIAGTCTYAAPEVSLGVHAITLKCDVFSFGMMLFEILQRKRISKDEDWYPLKVWECFKGGMLEEMILDCGIEKKDIEKAERLSIVGLWCTQFVPNNRPKMSDVVMVLEGKIQFTSPPPNPDTAGVFSSSKANGSSDDADKPKADNVQDEVKEHFKKGSASALPRQVSASSERSNTRIGGSTMPGYNRDELPEDVLRASNALENLQLDRKAHDLTSSWRRQEEDEDFNAGTEIRKLPMKYRSKIRTGGKMQPPPTREFTRIRTGVCTGSGFG